MKKILFITILMVNCLIGATLASVAGVAPAYGAIGVNAVGAIGNIAGTSTSVRATFYVEFWTMIVNKKLRNDAASVGWYDRLPNHDDLVDFNLIHYVNLGEDPTVLVNNTTYPLQLEDLIDTPDAISLDKYQTLPTRITDDQIRAMSYEKLPTVIERHKEVLLQKKYAKGLHALAPKSHTLNTPVLLTTGPLTADGSRRMLVEADINLLKNKLDMLKVPLTGRILVLNPDHVMDLNNGERPLLNMFNDRASGRITNFAGFDIYEYVDVPYYNVATKTKLAFEAIPTTGDNMASVAFYAPRGFRAVGATEMYFAEASASPRWQQTEVAFRQYFIAQMTEEKYMGAIVSNVE